MLVPCDIFVCTHIDGRFRRPKAVETGQCQLGSPAAGCGAYFDISFVETNIPLHNNTISPVRATETNRRVRVRKTRTAFHGGSRARAAFQLTPPFGKIMLTALSGGRREDQDEHGGSRRGGSTSWNRQRCVGEGLNECKGLQRPRGVGSRNAARLRKLGG